MHTSLVEIIKLLAARAVEDYLRAEAERPEGEGDERISPVERIEHD